jgi:hypothetical protein
VLNVAPEVGADNASVTVNESETAGNTGTFSDVGLDVVTVSSSIGSVTQSGTQSGTWSWSFDTSDGPDESQTVVITATDSDGAFTTTTFQLTVKNVDPSIDNAGDVTVDEGTTATNSGTFSDPGANGDGVMLSASVGTVNDTGNGTWSWSFFAADGPDDTQMVTITATDDDGAMTDTMFQLTVKNVPPSPSLNNGGNVTIGEGATAKNTGTFSDPGAGGDGVTLKASVGTVIDNGDGTWTWCFDGVAGPDDTQMVTITATDDDGASRSTTFQLTVVGPSPIIVFVLADDEAGVGGPGRAIPLDDEGPNSLAVDLPSSSLLFDANANSRVVKRDDLGAAGEEVVILEVLAPDGKLLRVEALPKSVLADLTGYARGLHDGHFRFFLDDGTSRIPILEVHVFGHQIVDPNVLHKILERRSTKPEGQQQPTDATQSGEPQTSTDVRDLSGGGWDRFRFPMSRLRVPLKVAGMEQILDWAQIVDAAMERLGESRAVASIPLGPGSPDIADTSND